MKALVFVGEKQMELKDIPLPVPKTDEYTIKIISTGICGSDFEGYLGKTGRRIPPMIMGHEAAGVIIAKPEGGRYDIGQRVVIFPKDYCGECEYCRMGKVNICPHGITMGVMQRSGSMTELIVISEKYLLPFSNSLPFHIAALTEPLAVALSSVNKLSDALIANAGYGVVIGAGTIGLLVISLLRLRGARNIIVSDVSDFRLKMAEQMGASYVVNPKREDFNAAIARITRGSQCDYSIEAVGTSLTAATSIDALKIFGTALWIGNAQKMVEINMQKIVTNELKIIGNYLYDLKDFTVSLRLLEEGKIDAGSIITDCRPLTDGVAVFKALEQNQDGRIVKVILENQ